MKKNISLYDIEEQFSRKRISNQIQFLILFILISLISISLWISQEKILLFLNKSSFSNIDKQFNIFEQKASQNGWDSISLQAIKKNEIEIKKLKEYQEKDNPLISFYLGKNEFVQFRKSLGSIEENIIDFLFAIYINKSNRLLLGCTLCIKNARIKILKSEVLKISSIYSIQKEQLLSNIYFWSGKHYHPYIEDTLKILYSKEILLNIKNSNKKSRTNKHSLLLDNILLYDIYSILYTKDTPNWSKLKTIFSPLEVEFLKILYHLSNKEIVTGIQMLQEVEKKVLNPKNNSVFWLYQYTMYLQGYEFGKRKRLHKQYNAYLHISQELFTQRHPWFKEEFRLTQRKITQNRSGIK